MSGALERIWEAWRKFWFETDGSRQMRLFRGIFGLLLFLFYSIRALDWRLFYTEQGLAPLSILPDLATMQYRSSLLILFPSDAAAALFTGLFLLSLLALSAGILPRISAIIAFVLHVSFLHRNMAVNFGADSIATFYLFYLCWADLRPQPKKDRRAMLGSMVFRLCQIQLCVIYGYSGLQKLKGVTWWSGEALWYVVQNFQLARWEMIWLAKFPAVLVIFSFATLFWEIYFPVLIWIRPLRRVVLGVGILMHLGISLMMNIPFFAATMVAAYVFFFDDAMIQNALTCLNYLKKRIAKISPLPTQVVGRAAE